jgi:3-oxoadipate enol-lactonase
MPAAKIGDIDIAYETHGEGPPLIAIMGLTGSRGHWRGFAERFADRHRVITFDNRGVGETSVPQGPYSTAQMADDALGLLDHLGIGTAIVFGVSMGGMIAQELALRAPDRVTKLILGCTSAGGSTLTLEPDTLAAFGSIGQDGAEATIRRLLSINFSPKFLSERADVFEELVQYGLAHRMKSTGFFGQMLAVTSHDASARVSELRMPTLLVTGNVDRLIPSENTRTLATAIPHARVVMLDGVGHMFWVEAPEATESAMRAFLR